MSISSGIMDLDYKERQSFNWVLTQIMLYKKRHYMQTIKKVKAKKALQGQSNKTKPNKIDI